MNSRKAEGGVSWLDPASQNPEPRIQELSANRVVIKANAIQVGTLVLTDLAYPGWNVTVDGESTDWQPIEGMFRSVELSPGEHTVLWVYRPASHAGEFGSRVSPAWSFSPSH